MYELASFWTALTRKKKNYSSEETKLARVLNLFDLTALGVGSTLGLGVYVLAGSVAYEQAGPAVVLSFVFAAIASAFAGLCYAELAARIPKAGSAYVYTYISIGEFIAFTIGWNLILEYIIGAASVARGLSSYIDELFEHRMRNFWKELVAMDVDFLAEYPDLLSFVIVAVLTVVLAAGVKESSMVHSFFTTINVLTVILVLVAGSLKLNPANWAIAKEDIPEGVRGGEGGFMPYGIAGVMAGAAKCFYGFVGFDCVATAGEEAKNAKKTIPLAVILTLIICVIIYIAISSILTMMWPYYDQNPETPLPHIFSQIGWHEIKWIVAIGAVFSLFSGLLGALFSLPRILYAMADDGMLFKFMSKVHPKTKTPLIAISISGFFSAVMAAIFSLQQLVDMLSIGTLLAYTIVAVSVLVLRYENAAEGKTQTKHDGCTEIMSFSIEKEPSKLSYAIAKISVTIFFLLTIILSYLVSYVAYSPANIVAMSIISGIMVIIICVIALQPTISGASIAFRVPLVPLLPCVSILCNTYLMLQLDGATWVRFGVWMIFGYIIYFGYGIKSSAENKKQEPSTEMTDGGVL